MKISKHIPLSTYLESIVWKPTVIPKGFVLVVDTREQLPFFTGEQLFPITRKTLHHGDYSVLGMENMVCVERKQTSDFLSYIGSERKKTTRKLTAMKDMYWKALVIETENPFDIPDYSRMIPEHIRGNLVSICVRYGLHVYWHKDRTELERWVIDRLVKCYNVLREV